MLQALARAALDLLLPAGCTGCAAPVADPGQLCAACFSELNFIGEPLCQSCGLPFPSTRAKPLCETCIAAPPPWGQARAALLYDAGSKALILPFKHAGREENAATLALHMLRAGKTLLVGAELLVPVPLHRSRLLARRYNQAALLAHALARRTGIRDLPDALLRIRATAPLGIRTAAKRAALLDGAIAVRPGRQSAIAGRRLVLIDDVMTSGATARACAGALLDAGAHSVDVLVASRVADPQRDRAMLPSLPKDNDADD